jgi:hypothetical protein
MLEEVDEEEIQAMTSAVADLAEKTEAAETLIALDEATETDFLKPMAIYAKKLQLYEQEHFRLSAQEKRLKSQVDKARAKGEQDPDQVRNAVVAVVASREVCSHRAMDVCEVAKRLGPTFQKELDAEASRVADGHTAVSKLEGGAPHALHVKSGAALSSFDAATWACCFTEFFYGDCLPFDHDRKQHLGLQKVCHALLDREELEYHLESDSERYKALPTSRWDPPAMAAVFGDTMRRMRLLQATQQDFKNGGEGMKQDLANIASAKPSDFEAYRHYTTLGRLFASQEAAGIVLLPQTPVHEHAECAVDGRPQDEAQT